MSVCENIWRRSRKMGVVNSQVDFRVMNRKSYNIYVVRDWTINLFPVLNIISWLKQLNMVSVFNRFLTLTQHYREITMWNENMLSMKIHTDLSIAIKVYNWNWFCTYVLHLHRGSEENLVGGIKHTQWRTQIIQIQRSKMHQGTWTPRSIQYRNT